MTPPDQIKEQNAFTITEAQNDVEDQAQGETKESKQKPRKRKKDPIEWRANIRKKNVCPVKNM